MAALVPLAVLFESRRKSKLAFVALVLFAVPFETVASLGLYLPAAALAAALLLVEVRARGPIVVAVSSLVIGAGFEAHAIAYAQVALHTRAIANPGPNALASLTWEAFSSLTDAFPLWWFLKAITMAPAVAFASLMMFYAFGGRTPFGVDRATAIHSGWVARGAV